MSHSGPHRRRRHRRRVVPGSAPGLLKTPEGAPLPVLRVVAYGPAGLVEGRIEAPAELAAFRDKWAVTWLDVTGLGDGEVLKAIGEVFGIHRLALEDVVNVPQRPKAETYPDHHFVVAQQVHRLDLRELEQVSFFVGEGFVLTFQEREGDWFDGVRDRIRKGHGLIRREGSDYLTYALLDAVVDSYFPALEQLGEELEALEDRILHDPSTDAMGEVRQLKRRLLSLRRNAWPQREMVGHLLRSEQDWLSAETRTHMRDCQDHAVQVLDLIETHREMAGGLMDFYMSVVGQRMNEVMKVLTITATIFIPLSFIAGLYGMNFDPQASPWNMPELGMRFGYPAALIGMASLACGMLLVFRHRGWLGRPRRRPSAESRATAEGQGEGVPQQGG